MAIASPNDFAGSAPKIGPKTALVAFYVLIAVVAIGVAAPAAIMSADTAIFVD